MPHLFISELKSGDKINQFFLIKRKERRRTKTGKDYLDLTLADRSGTLNGKIWSEGVTRFDPLFKEGHFAAVAGRIESFQEDRQLTVERIRGIEHFPAEQLESAGYDPDLLLPATPLDTEVLWKDLLTWVEEEISDPSLQALTLALLRNQETEWKTWPASKLYHHAYRGGLLEHTHRVVQLARSLLPHFPELNGDLVLAGTILHDMGKLKELEGGLSASNTVDGELFGHLVLGWAMVRESARDLSWEDPALLSQLEHILLAHHGQLEFGSPVLPQTREALLVHMVDDLEGKLKMMTDHLEGDRSDRAFTEWHKVLKRKIFKESAAGKGQPAGEESASGGEQGDSE
jgi:3'-5' exoribonuclease